MLRFQLFGFPVQIQPGFWFLALLLGYQPGRSAASMALWVTVVFVSVMIHELGHAVAARAYGQAPVITLHMMGGLTSWRQTHELGKKRRIIVTFAGPLAGFVLGGVAGLVLLAMTSDGARSDDSSMLLTTIELLCLANLFWSAINLLPVLPFDGGQILAAALGPERRMLAATLSLAFGLVVALVLYRMGSLFGAVIFGMGGISSYLAARRGPARSVPDAALEQVLTRARQALEREDHETAEQLARAAAHAAGNALVRRKALEIAAWAALGKGAVPVARAVLKELPREPPPDPYLEGAVSQADGDLPRARGVLRAARAEGDRRPALAGLLVRVELESGDAAAAARLALEIADDSDEDDLRRVAAAAFDAGAADPAAALLMVVFDRSGRPSDAFDAARAFARAGARGAAVAALHRAVLAGLDEPERARSDSDLAPLAGDTGFESALAGAAR